MELKRQPDETLEQYLWRVGTAKDNGQVDLTWPELVDIINPQFFENEEDYLGDSAYRKRYAIAKKFYEDVFSKTGNTNAHHAEMISELRRERQKLSDERVAINRQDRNLGRLQRDLEQLEKVIKETAYEPFNVSCNLQKSDNDLLICLSDIHYGLDVSNAFGSYSPEIARERAKQYLEEIVRIANTYDAKNAFVSILGDTLSGSIHPSVRLENRDNLIQQIQGASELIAEFIYELSKRFENVLVDSVAGNHSRTFQNKEEVLRNERLDDLIPWYIRAKLSNIKNVSFMDEYNIDPTIGGFSIRGKDYVIVHGDYDAFNEAGVSKLVMMLGGKPEAVLYGHLHHNSFDSIADIKLIRSGSFVGTCDDYSVSKRLSGKPSQMVVVVSDKGVESLHPITLA